MEKPSKELCKLVASHLVDRINDSISEMCCAKCDESWSVGMSCGCMSDDVTGVNMVVTHRQFTLGPVPEWCPLLGEDQ
jgi:hypothetical protein